MSGGLTRLFPLALMLALALLTFLLQRAVLEEQPHPSLRRHDPDFIIESFRITKYGRDGQPESTLTGTRMTHYPDDDSTEVSEPRLVQTRRDEPQVTVTANTGAVDGNSEDVFLYGDVVLVRDATAERSRMRMDTTFLHVVQARSIVRTDREVILQDDERHIRARGMEYHNATQLLYLRERVRSRFEPKKSPS